jgi:hypothetical protein
VSRYPGFIGPTYTSRSVNVDAEELINWYPETSGSSGAKVSMAYYPTPALRPWLGVGSGPVRGLFEQDGRAYCVSGTAFAEIFASQTVTFRGTVQGDGNPASMASNGTAGNQVGVCSGGRVYMLNTVTNLFTQVFPGGPDTGGLPDPCIALRFTDGYFLGLQGQSRRFAWSELEDGTLWNGLDFAEVSEGSDNVLAMEINHREVTLFGSKTSEIWVDAGDANNTFQPLDGTFIEKGIKAPFSSSRNDNTLIFLGGDERGAGVVWKMNGYTPVRISTFAIETMINRLGRFDNALGWTYEQEGHLFYVLYLPNADLTPVYDISTGLWHKRGHWNPTTMTWQPWRASCHCFAFGKHLVGDPLSGMIYSLELDQFTDRIVIL